MEVALGTSTAAEEAECYVADTDGFVSIAVLNDGTATTPPSFSAYTEVGRLPT